MSNALSTWPLRPYIYYEGQFYIVKAILGTGILKCCVPSRNPKIALALLGRGSLHPLTTWGENLGVRAYPETVRPCKLPRPKIARAIQKSFYYVETVKFTILGLDQQFSPNNKEFFFHIYQQKIFCSFSFLRLEFSFGMLFTQFGNFSKSSCQHTVSALSNP